MHILFKLYARPLFYLMMHKGGKSQNAGQKCRPAGSKMAEFNDVTHIIFDLDGTLLDTEVIYHQVYGEVCASFGKEYTWETKLLHMGTQERDSARILIEHFDIPTSVDEFVEMESSKVKPLLPNTKFMPGAECLVKHFSEHNIPIAVATSSSEEAFNLKITNHKEMFSLFHHVVPGGSDPEVVHGKPAPDIYLICASRFPDKPPPKKVLVFEDAPNGVQGCKAAGMQVVMVPSTRTTEQQRNEATLAIESLSDFKPELFGLPPIA